MKVKGISKTIANMLVMLGLPLTTVAQTPAVSNMHAMQDHDHMAGPSQSSSHMADTSMQGRTRPASNTKAISQVARSNAEMSEHESMKMPEGMPMGDSVKVSERPTDMPMQEMSASAGARDPDAYSDGFTRNEGPFALAPRYRLRMGDEDWMASARFDKLEYARAGGVDYGVYDGQAWFGGTYNRLVIKAEGEVSNDKLQEARTELLWGHAISTYWDTQLGSRFDYGRGEPSRQWLAAGVQGLAPYWFEVDATAYVGSQGRTVLRLNANYDIKFSQRMYLQPAVEMNFYGRNDPERQLGAGLSDIKLGMRLKYEITRQIVPYAGVEWSGKLGQTAQYAEQEGSSRHEARFVAGLSLWF